MNDEKAVLTDLLNVVVDLSHHNQTVDFKKAAQNGILGVIHKATQGTTYTDPTYQERRKLAVEAGLMWGAYHFGIGGDGNAQAEYFLKEVNPDPGDLLVLDLEMNPGGSSMTLQEAEDFVTYIYRATGCWPGLYSGSYIKKDLGNPVDTLLSNCWFWLAQYGSIPVVPNAWKDWTMWQYTDGTYGPEPHTVNGIGNCDRDKFNGSLIDLKKLWHQEGEL